jgi:predicted nucleic acid-binding Zn ribbon protein
VSAGDLARRGPTGDPRSLQEALTAALRELGLPGPGVTERVDALWQEIVGPVLGAHTAVRSVRDGVCTVVADGPVWATQLRYLTGELVARAAQALGTAVVREVRVVVGGR